MSNIKQQILEKLNEQQKEPVINYHGPSAVIAGPGSGKTATLISRCAYMIEDGVFPSNILLFTFTRKAANEIQERLLNKIGDAANLVTVGTYHSFCGRLLRKYSDKIGWQKNFTIYDDDDKNRVIKKLLKENEDEERFKSRQLGAYFSRFKEKMISPNLAKNQAKNFYEKIVADYYEKYNTELKINNAFDFDDLIYFTIRLFENNKEILEKVNRKFTYIMADECQDSSPRDLLLIKYLGGLNFNICCFADDDQSIYSFRGVQIKNYYKFIEENNLRTYILGRNYRSTQTIVEASQSLISKNKNRINKNLFTCNENGNKIAYVSLQDPEMEAEYVSRTIKALKNTGYCYKDIAILYRVSYLSRIIEKSLFNNNIPYNITGGCAFYNRMEIKDIMSFLRYIYNPNDLIALERIINVPKRGIGEKTLDKIIKTCQIAIERGKMALDALKEIKIKGKAKQGLSNFIAIIEQLRENDIDDVDILIDRILNLTNYVDGYLCNEEDGMEDEDVINDRIGNIEELKLLASKSINLSDFINTISLFENEIKTDTDNQNDKVSLMTIHASKGLEFPVVIIIGANQEVIPHRLAVKNDTVDEERRLFYVALTRAKKEVFITRPKKAFQNYKLTNFSQSQFLTEIDKNYLEIR